MPFLLLQLLVKGVMQKSQGIQSKYNSFFTQATENQQQVLIMGFKLNVSSLCVCLQTANSLHTHMFQTQRYWSMQIYILL